MQNNFGLADTPLPGGGFPRGNGDIEPFDVFDSAAPVANKVMVTMQIRVEARGLPFARHLADLPDEDQALLQTAAVQGEHVIVFGQQEVRVAQALDVLSSMAMIAPWAMYCSGGWAASPSSATRP